MIDLLKYSKKNFLFRFIITKILFIDIDLLDKNIFLDFNLKIIIDKNFFYDYQKKFPQTKWMQMSNASKFYQSNHDLIKIKELSIAKKKFEELLNNEVKSRIFKKKTLGKFKIKSMWFTIQKKNEGHHYHNHPKSIYSGVFYVDFKENSGGEIILDIENNKKVYAPKKNDLIIFNSSIFHSVNPYLSDVDRIAVAWDAIYTI